MNFVINVIIISRDHTPILLTKNKKIRKEVAPHQIPRKVATILLSVSRGVAYGSQFLISKPIM